MTAQGVQAPPLQVNILGTPVFIWNNHPLRIMRRIPRALLIYLAVKAMPVSRNEIMVVFWPEESEASARRFLRDNLSKLRSALPDPSMLSSDIELVSLDPQRTQVDLLQFQELFNKFGNKVWNNEAGKGFSGESLVEFQQAANLWRSHRLLAGISYQVSLEFETWLSTLEEDLLLKLTVLYKSMSAACCAAGDHKACLHWLQQLAAVDPFHEDTHREIIMALVRSGNKREAWRYGNKVILQFEQELNLPPSLPFVEFVAELADNPQPAKKEP